MQPLLKLVLLVVLLTAAPALAQDAAAPAAAEVTNKNNTAHKLQPEGCEFEITLPGEPYNTRRCDPENPDNCSKIISYTKTFGLDATVNFEVSCNPVDAGTFDKFNTDVIKTTLMAMIGTDKLEEFKDDVYQTDKFKQAMLVGTGKMIDNDRLYTAQLWIGHKSIFTVEGEVIGYAGNEADKMFADVIASARYVEDAAPQKDADEKKDSEEDKDKGEKPAEAPKKP